MVRKNRFLPPLLWGLFFLICLGLGYPTLNRYDPKEVPGTGDSLEYAKVVTDGPQRVRTWAKYRVLIPYVARPVYRMAQGRVGTWDPVFLGLLAANALFCATGAFLLVNIGTRITGSPAVGLLGALFYLVNFSVPNGQLSGLVDSGEGGLLIAVVWALLAGRWGMLPILCIVGTLAKETFLPLSLVFVLTWWLAAVPKEGWRPARLGWSAAMGLTALAAFALLHAVVSGGLSGLWSDLLRRGTVANFPRYTLPALLNPGLGYVFVWLLPLGVWRLKHFPRAWVWASAATGLTVLLGGIYAAGSGGYGSVPRVLFNYVGPLLSLSVAVLVAGCGKEHSVKGLLETVPRSQTC